MALPLVGVHRQLAGQDALGGEGDGSFDQLLGSRGAVLPNVIGQSSAVSAATIASLSPPARTAAMTDGEWLTDMGVELLWRRRIASWSLSCWVVRQDRMGDRPQLTPRINHQSGGTCPLGAAMDISQWATGNRFCSAFSLIAQRPSGSCRCHLLVGCRSSMSGTTPKDDAPSRKTEILSAVKGS